MTDERREKLADFIDHPYWRLRSALFAGRGVRLSAEEVDFIISTDGAVCDAISSMEGEAENAGYRLRRTIDDYR